MCRCYFSSKNLSFFFLCSWPFFFGPFDVILRCSLDIQRVINSDEESLETQLSILRSQMEVLEPHIMNHPNEKRGSSSSTKTSQQCRMDFNKAHIRVLEHIGKGIVSTRSEVNAINNMLHKQDTMMRQLFHLLDDDSLVESGPSCANLTTHSTRSLANQMQRTELHRLCKEAIAKMDEQPQDEDAHPFVTQLCRDICHSLMVDGFYKAKKPNRHWDEPSFRSVLSQATGRLEECPFGKGSLRLIDPTGNAEEFWVLPCFLQDNNEEENDITIAAANRATPNNDTSQRAHVVPHEEDARLAPDNTTLFTIYVGNNNTQHLMKPRQKKLIDEVQGMQEKLQENNATLQSILDCIQEDAFDRWIELEKNTASIQSILDWKIQDTLDRRCQFAIHNLDKQGGNANYGVLERCKTICHQLLGNGYYRDVVGTTAEKEFCNFEAELKFTEEAVDLLKRKYFGTDGLILEPLYNDPSGKKSILVKPTNNFLKKNDPN